MYTRKENEADAWKRLDAFWNGSSLGRPALSLWTPDPRHKPDPFPVQGRGEQSVDFDPSYYAHTARDNLLGAIFLAESFPCMSVDPGRSLALTALAAGGTYHVSAGNTWIVEQKGLLDAPPPARASEDVLHRYASCVSSCAEAIGDMGFVSPSTLLDPVTTLSQKAGPEELSVALCERPERVHVWIEALTEVWLALLRTGAQASRSDASAVFWGPVTRGTAACLQCDYAVMLSPEMFVEFVLPAQTRMASVMSHTLYHLDGVAQMRFLDKLAQIPNCRGIQWNPETDYCLPTRHLDALREIRARGMSLFLQVETLEEAIATVQALGPDGLFIKFRRCFPTRSEADMAIGELERASR